MFFRIGSRRFRLSLNPVLQPHQIAAEKSWRESWRLKKRPKCKFWASIFVNFIILTLLSYQYNMIWTQIWPLEIRVGFGMGFFRDLFLVRSKNPETRNPGDRDRDLKIPKKIPSGKSRKSRNPRDLDFRFLRFSEHRDFFGIFWKSPGFGIFSWS